MNGKKGNTIIHNKNETSIGNGYAEERIDTQRPSLSDVSEGGPVSVSPIHSLAYADIRPRCF